MTPRLVGLDQIGLVGIAKDIDGALIVAVESKVQARREDVGVRHAGWVLHDSSALGQQVVSDTGEGGLMHQVGSTFGENGRLPELGNELEERCPRPDAVVRQILTEKEDSL